jgi:hypothetical protein
MDDEQKEDAETAQEPVVPEPPPAVVEAAPAVAVQSEGRKTDRRRSVTSWIRGLLSRKR